jgi:outer membrane protein, heavy metal efflux system
VLDVLDGSSAMEHVSDARAWRLRLAARCLQRGAAALVIVWLWPAAPAAAQQSQSPVARLTMEQAVDLALARNQTMRARRLDVDAAKADALTASLKPNVSFTSVNADLPLLSPSQLNWDFLKNGATYVQSFSYLFERGGKRRNRMLAAADATDLAVRTVTDAERQLRLQTAQAFIDVLFAKSTLELAQQNLASFSNVVDISRQRLTAGDLSQNDYYKVSLQRLQFEQDVSVAEVQLVQARVQLRQLVGYDTVTDDFDVIGDLAYRASSVTLDELRAAALASRPDLLAAQSGLKLAQDAVTLERSNAARDVTGEVEYDRDGSFNGIGLGLSIDLPIHDRNQGNIARAQVAARQADETAAAARMAVLADVDGAYAAFQANAKIVSLFQSGYLDQAQQSLDISRYIYQRGAGSLLDLLDAERTYRSTQVAFRQALAAYMASIHQINFVVGKQVVQ